MAAYRDVPVEDELAFFVYVTINKSETKVDESSGKKYSAYILEIQTNSAEWVVKRRYREFDALYNELEETYPERPLPEFPLKTLWGELDRKVVEKRRILFEGFLRGIISDPFMNRSGLCCTIMSNSYTEALMKFLDVPNHKG